MSKNNKHNEIKKCVYQVNYFGWKECYGMRGQDIIQPIAKDMIYLHDGQALPRLLIEVSKKELRIVQLVEKKKGKTEKVKYPSVQGRDVTFSSQVFPPENDVVACIYLGYNPDTRCVVHTHVYKFESSTLAARFVDHLQQIIDLPKNRERIGKMEEELIKKGQILPSKSPYATLPSSNLRADPTYSAGQVLPQLGMLLPSSKAVVNGKRNEALSPEETMAEFDAQLEAFERETMAGNPRAEQEEIYRGRPPQIKASTSNNNNNNSDYIDREQEEIYGSLAAELRAKLKSKDDTPILLPPKDYDTISRTQGNLRDVETRKCLNPKIVGRRSGSASYPENDDNEDSEAAAIKEVTSLRNDTFVNNNTRFMPSQNNSPLDGSGGLQSRINDFNRSSDYFEQGGPSATSAILNKSSDTPGEELSLTEKILMQSFGVMATTTANSKKAATSFNEQVATKGYDRQEGWTNAKVAKEEVVVSTAPPAIGFSYSRQRSNENYGVDPDTRIGNTAPFEETSRLRQDPLYGGVSDSNKRYGLSRTDPTTLVTNRPQQNTTEYVDRVDGYSIQRGNLERQYSGEDRRFEAQAYTTTYTPPRPFSPGPYTQELQSSSYFPRDGALPNYLPNRPPPSYDVYHQYPDPPFPIARNNGNYPTMGSPSLAADQSMVAATAARPNSMQQTPVRKYGPTNLGLVESQLQQHNVNPQFKMYKVYKESNEITTPMDPASNAHFSDYSTLSSGPANNYYPTAENRRQFVNVDSNRAVGGAGTIQAQANQYYATSGRPTNGVYGALPPTRYAATTMEY